MSEPRFCGNCGTELTQHNLQLVEWRQRVGRYCSATCAVQDVLDQPPMWEIEHGIHEQFPEEEGPRTEEIHSFVGLLRAGGFRIVRDVDTGIDREEGQNHD